MPKKLKVFYYLETATCVKLQIQQAYKSGVFYMKAFYLLFLLFILSCNSATKEQQIAKKENQNKTALKETKKPTRKFETSDSNLSNNFKTGFSEYMPFSFVPVASQANNKNYSFCCCPYSNVKYFIFL